MVDGLMMGLRSLSFVLDPSIWSGLFIDVSDDKILFVHPSL